MDRNPLRWQAFNLDETKFEDEAKSYVRQIVNTGGSTQEYTITNIPIWVDVFPTNGFLTLAKHNSLLLNSAAIWCWALLRIPSLWKAHKGMSISGLLRNICRSPEWELDPTAYSNSMNLSVELDIQGELSEDKMDIVAAFIDDELRGKSYIVYVPAVDKYMAFLTVYNNDFVGGTVEFQSGTLMNVCFMAM